MSGILTNNSLENSEVELQFEYGNAKKMDASCVGWLIIILKTSDFNVIVSIKKKPTDFNVIVYKNIYLKIIVS